MSQLIEYLIEMIRDMHESGVISDEQFADFMDCADPDQEDSDFVQHFDPE